MSKTFYTEKGSIPVVKDLLFSCKSIPVPPIFQREFRIGERNIGADKNAVVKLGLRTNTMAEDKCSILLMGIENVAHDRIYVSVNDKDMFIEKKNAWKTLVCRGSDKYTVMTDAKKEDLPDVVGTYLFMEDICFANDMPHSRTVLQGIKDGKMFADSDKGLATFMDAYYYELKNNSIRYATPSKKTTFVYDVEIEYEVEEMDSVFSKIDSTKGLKVPNDLQSLNWLTKGQKYFPCFSLAISENDDEETLEAFFEKCKKGEFRKFEYFYPNRENIPELSDLDSYAPSDEFRENLEQIYIAQAESFGVPYADRSPVRREDAKSMPREYVLNMAFFGPPGTGKSRMATAIAAALGIPITCITGFSEMDEQNFDLLPVFGDEGLRLIEQPFRKAFREGGIVLVDEVNLVRPGVLLGALSGALEAPYVLGQTSTTDNDALPGRVNRSAHTVVITTCNPGAAGANRQNTAFYSRFNSWTEFKATTKEQLFAKAKANFAAVEEKTMELVYEVYEQIQKILKEEMSDMEEFLDLVGPRAFFAALASYTNQGKRLEAAIESAMLNPLICLGQEKREETYDELKTKLIDEVRHKLIQSEYQIRRKVKLV